MNSDQGKSFIRPEECDLLVIGSGIAGLSLVAEIAGRFPELRVTILSKNEVEESNTRYAQGGIAVVTDSQHDSVQQHIADTLMAGDGVCDPEIVNMVVREGPARLQALIQWGVQFDKDSTGKLLLSKEGGHSANRVVHFSDSTGHEISQSLLRFVRLLPNVTLFQGCFAIDLITSATGKKVCRGVYAIDTHADCIRKFIARATVLATGGAGQVYKTTTNPLIATGDGIAMAYRQGAEVKDMEFIQFHPTALHSERDNPSFLISEAIRGFGAHVINQSGERFLFKYDVRGELASRDIVSKAIYNEIYYGTGHVYIDCRHLPAADVIMHFPSIYERCQQRGINITTQPVPVVPAAHYVCGGVVVDKNARTCISNLYAVGECAFTGLHGANRLASNSLLEALVFAHRCCNHLVTIIKSIPIADAGINVLDGYSVSAKHAPWQYRLRDELRELMDSHAGIVRSSEKLLTALKRVESLNDEVETLLVDKEISPQLCELKNLITVAKLIITQSIERTENKGGFFNTDLAPENRQTDTYANITNLHSCSHS